MPVTPEQEWTVEVRLRGTTFGTEAQARATAERWHHALETFVHRDVELLEVVVRQPGNSDCETCEGQGVIGLVKPLDPCPDCVSLSTPSSEEAQA